MLELVLVILGSLVVIGITLTLIFLWGARPVESIPPPAPAPSAPAPSAPAEIVYAAPPPKPAAEAPRSEGQKIKLLTISRGDVGCRKDEECGAGFVCIRSQLESNGNPYINELFERYGASIEDAYSLDGKIYFLLDRQRLAVVNSRNETTLFQTHQSFVQLTGFNRELYARTESGELYVFRKEELIRVPPEEPVSYFSATPDGNYLYVNNKLYDCNLQVIKEFPSPGPRVFLNPNTYVNLGEKPTLIQDNQPSSVGLPPRLTDAAFNARGELFLLEPKEERYRKIVVVGGEPFLITRRRCQKI